MRNRNRVIAAGAVTAALAAGTTGAALASATGAKPDSSAKTISASQKPGGSRAVGSKSAEERRGHDAITSVVAEDLHISVTRVRAALRPLFAAGTAYPSSAALAAAARSLGVSIDQLSAALVYAKQSLAAVVHATQSPGRSKPFGSKSAEQRQGHGAITAMVAEELHVSTARVSAALRPLFAAGTAYPSSPLLAAAARSLGVGTDQLLAALAHAKQRLATGG
jgi:2-hydroxychromene-2-carboxylate isomerase